MDYFASIKHRFQDDRINTVLSQLTNIVRIDCRIEIIVYTGRECIDRYSNSIIHSTS